MQRAGKEDLSKQMKRRTSSEKTEPEKEDGNFGSVISTGSTLLDLAISGGRIHGGGVPSGILVEIFGPNGSGKTVLLSQMAGNVLRKGGRVLFGDPEARLNPEFAKLFGLELDEKDYTRPDTVTEVFQAVRQWEPEGGDAINGIFTDSLAALSTDMELEAKEGDKMGMRRAKEFSQELRTTCRLLKQKNYLMVCSNQIRENLDAGPYGQKYRSPGGEAIGFYASLRLQTSRPEKLYREATIAGKKVKRAIGIEIQVNVFKSSIWKPYRSAPVTILFDYGIDDIRQNLQFVKDYTKSTVYTIGGNTLSRSLEESIKMIEDGGYETKLRKEVIKLWEEIESKFDTERKPRQL